MAWLHRRIGRRTVNPAAKKALEEASENLQRVKDRTPEVQEVARALKILRERNHFREQLEFIMGGGC